MKLALDNGTQLNPLGGVNLKPTGTVVEELRPFVESEVKLLLQGNPEALFRRLVQQGAEVVYIEQNYAERKTAAKLTKKYGVVPSHLEPILSNMEFKRFRVRKTTPIQYNTGMVSPSSVMAQSKLSVFGGLVCTGLFRPLKLELGKAITTQAFKKVKKNSVGSLRKLRFRVPLSVHDWALEVDFLFASGEGLGCTNKVLVTADLEFPPEQGVEAAKMLEQVTGLTGADFLLVVPGSRLHEAIANYGIAQHGLKETYKWLSKAGFLTPSKVQSKGLRKLIKSLMSTGSI
jgi:hypothetical protein